jgi:hypothetical protein
VWDQALCLAKGYNPAPSPNNLRKIIEEADLAPGALLTIVGGTQHGVGVGLGRVTVDCGCGLGAEVADFRIEIERSYAVRAVRAGELHAVLDALDAVGFH